MYQELDLDKVKTQIDKKLGKHEAETKFEGNLKSILILEK